jgi:hypothetical protein
MSAIGSVIYSSIFDCQLPIAVSDFQLEIGNRKSAMSFSPARFHHAGNLSLQRQLAKANATQMKLAQIAARSAASLATRVRA